MVADTHLTFEEFYGAISAYCPQPVDLPTPLDLWNAGESIGEIAERLSLPISDVAAAIQNAEAA